MRTPALSLRPADAKLERAKLLSNRSAARLELPLSGPATAAADLGWELSGAAPSADPGRTDITWTFQGSMHHDDWMIPGARFPAVTTPQVPHRADLLIDVRNLSATHHPFHKHGAHLAALSTDARPHPDNRVEHTVNYPRFPQPRMPVWSTAPRAR